MDLGASLVAQLVKNPPAIRRPWFDSWVRKVPWRRDTLPTLVFLGFSGGQLVKNLPTVREKPGFDPWVGKISWRRQQLPTPVFWPGGFHGLYSPWGHKEPDMTERLSCHFTSLWILTPFLFVNSKIFH